MDGRRGPRGAPVRRGGAADPAAGEGPPHRRPGHRRADPGLQRRARRADQAGQAGLRRQARAGLAAPGRTATRGWSALQPVDGRWCRPRRARSSTGFGRIVGRVTSSRMSPDAGPVDLPGSGRGAPGRARHCRRDPAPGRPPGGGAGDGAASALRPGRRAPAWLIPWPGALSALLSLSSSPAGRWRGRAAAAPLTLADLSALAKTLVRAPAEGAMASALGVPFARARPGTQAGRWSLVPAPASGSSSAPLGEGAAQRARLESAAAGWRAGELVTVLDLTHGRALIRLTGPAAPASLAKVCAIDLADHRTPSGTALRTSVAKLTTDLVRDDQQACSVVPAALRALLRPVPLRGPARRRRRVRHRGGRPARPPGRRWAVSHQAETERARGHPPASSRPEPVHRAHARAGA